MIYYNIYQINLFSRKCKCTTVFLKKRLKSINLMLLIIEFDETIQMKSRRFLENRIWLK